jgi:hypothetical protein
MRKKGETGIDTHHRLYPLRATANADLSVFGKVGTEGAGFWSKWCRDVRGAARRVGTPNQFTCRFEPGAPVGVSTVGWTGKEKWAPEAHVIPCTVLRVNPASGEMAQSVHIPVLLFARDPQGQTSHARAIEPQGN